MVGLKENLVWSQSHKSSDFSPNYKSLALHLNQEPEHLVPKLNVKVFTEVHTQTGSAWTI